MPDIYGPITNQLGGFMPKGDVGGPASGGESSPIVSSNRPATSQNLIKNMFNESLDDIDRALEGVPKSTRGSRKKPSIMKYPSNIGSGEFPHVMQFKVFWRFESKDALETLQNLKRETTEAISELSTISGLISSGSLDEGIIQQGGGMSDEQISALDEMINDTNLLKVVDPSSNDTLASVLSEDPDKAKSIIEETVRSYQTRLSSIDAEISDGIGKVSLDEQERSLVFDRLTGNIQEADLANAAVTGAAAAGIPGAAVGYIVGGKKGALIGGGVAAVAGAATTTSAAAAAKFVANNPVYDQMISVYLPFCGKINNEDSFQYEDPSQAVASAFFDAVQGEMLDTAGQAITVGAEKLGGLIGARGAIGIGSGKVFNPRLEKLFRQKDFRSFSFSWELYPRNKQEVEQIREIIEAFRYHSHPAIDSDPSPNENESKVQIILRVPAEFEIRFLSTNPDPKASGFVENEYLPKIGRCALNAISVDYTPNAIYSSFADNSPTAITVTMQFTEMGVLTREGVEKGF